MSSSIEYLLSYMLELIVPNFKISVRFNNIILIDCFWINTNLDLLIVKRMIELDNVMSAKLILNYIFSSSKITANGMNWIIILKLNYWIILLP